MKVLVLGANSAADGERVGGETWVHVVRDGLEQLADGVLDFELAAFAPFGEGAVAYGERRVRTSGPDLVLIPVGPYVFSFGFVWVRVRTLFGKRAAARYKRFEEGFDRRTRTDPTVASRANSWVRKGIRALVGTQPLATQSEVTACYSELLSVLARVEQVQVAVLAYPGRAPAKRGASKGWPTFYSEMQRATESHHFIWVDGRDGFGATGAPADVLAGDGLHPSVRSNRIFGEAVLAGLRGDSVGAHALNGIRSASL